MALKPIEPGKAATPEQRETYQRAQVQAREQPHLWANGPEHQVRAKESATDPPRGAEKK
jgi:hypothetical protein